MNIFMNILLLNEMNLNSILLNEMNLESQGLIQLIQLGALPWSSAPQREASRK
jgi:hypothetical protein